MTRPATSSAAIRMAHQPERRGDGTAPAPHTARTGSPIRALDGSGAEVGGVGGKAAALDRLVAEGFAVPSAFAVTTDAYEEFVEAGHLAPLLRELAEATLPGLEDSEEEMARVDRAFLDAPVPDGVEVAVRDAARELLASGPVAVRSSATAEDTGTASFAGQYRSFLDLNRDDEVLEAVRKCWASLWTPSVRAYRRREGVPEAGLSMGVIIQAMVPAEMSGVLFTRDPSGDARTARVEVVRGLGESLVSGCVTPDDYRVDRATLAVHHPEPADWPPFLEDLMRMGLQIERRMGMPQDVEWAFADGELWVLQARPITVRGAPRPSADEFDTEPVPEATYTPIGVQEMLPEVLPPLLWTINAPMLDEAFRRLFWELGISPPAAPRGLLAIGRFRGRAALNLSALREAAALMPGGSHAEVERQYLGRSLSGDAVLAPRRGKVARGLAGLRALRLRRRVEDEVDLFAEAVHGVIALQVDLALPAHRLLTYRARVRDLAYRGYAAEVAAAAGAAAAYRALEMALERWVGREAAATWAQRITTSPQLSASGVIDPTTTMWDLYVRGIRGRDACTCIRLDPFEGVEDRIRAMGEEGELLLVAIDRVARHFGSMSMYGGPTWDEDRSIVLERLAHIARCEEGGHEASPDARVATSKAARGSALGELQSELRRSWKWRATRLLTGQIVDVRGRMVHKLASDASRFLMLREKAKAALLVLGGEERRLILEAARRLQASGVLFEDEDVLLLSDAELEGMLMGAEPVSAEDLDRRRRALARAREGSPLPGSFRGFPGVEEVPPLDGEELRGWAASPGRARGRARILRGLADASTLMPGEILVARSTDPSWTPLFLVAGGIVLEEGGPLSHAAIVAREFGVPAVVNVKGATHSLATGEDVEVDGVAGVVIRTEEAA